MADDFALQPKPPEQEKGVEEPASVSKKKKIVVCCDGTGNEFAGKDATNSNSNVVKFYTALKLDGEQIAYYHPGVGTMGDPTKKGIGRGWSVVKGLAFGAGFEDNVLDAYRYLMQHYNSGDTVYVLGFSRGAYTARALAGLLHGYGLLCRGNEGHIPYAWRMYTQRVQDQRQQDRHSIETDYSFCNTFSHKDFMLHFVGLWDTVSSVGWISTPLRLLHLAQNSTILHGRHAVSIDERRCFYQDNLWGEPVEVEYTPVLIKDRGMKGPQMQDMLQAWFSGVHSDVGGSYPQLKSGLSNITLQWMMDEAEAQGIVFDPMRRDVVMGVPVVDTYGLSAAILPLYERPTSAPVHESLNAPWWPLEMFPHRYYDRDDLKEKMRIPMGAWRAIPPGAIVHSSVRTRMLADVCYRPCNLALEEIETRAQTLGTTRANPDGYFIFKPIECRGGRWRENWLVVFLVSVLEIALGLYLLGKLLWALGIAAIWVGEALGWLGHHARPEVNYDYIGSRYAIFERFVMWACSPHWQWMLHAFWPIFAAAAFVVWRSVAALLRRLRT